MKILLDMGHTLQGSDTGAQGNGYREENCTREIGYKVKSKLEALGHTVVICSCDSASSLGESLAYRVNKANSSGGDLYVSIHINAGNGVGVEIYTYGAKHFTEADNILNNIVGLGYVNRGIKDGSHLYVIRNTNMNSLLVECCFIDSSDMQRYNAENFANAIVKGLVGQTVDIQPSQPQNNLADKIAQSAKFVGSRCLELQQKLNKVMGTSISEDGIFGNESYNLLISFQQKYLPNGVDGLAGTNTFSKLDSLIEQMNQPTPSNLYRVRKSWEDASSQLGAYANLQSAIDLAKSNKDYNVYDSNGKVVWSSVPQPVLYNGIQVSPIPDNLKASEEQYLKDYPDVANAVQQGSFASGYQHYLIYGKSEGRYFNENPQNTPIENNVTILGDIKSSSEQMVTFLLKNNSNPQLNSMNPLDFCKLYIEEGKRLGVRGDIAFCQSCKETGYFKYGGQVLPEQNNYAGIGATNNSPVGKGAWFKTQQEGVKAVMQHLFAYASKDTLQDECIDPRFNLVNRGIAPNWIDLNGKWAVPGNTYGQDILNLYDNMCNTQIDEELIKELSKTYVIQVTLKDKNLVDKCKTLLEQNGYTIEIKEI